MCVKITYAILFCHKQLCWAGKQLLVFGTLLQKEFTFQMKYQRPVILDT